MMRWSGEFRTRTSGRRGEAQRGKLAGSLSLACCRFQCSAALVPARVYVRCYSLLRSGKLNSSNSQEQVERVGLSSAAIPSTSGCRLRLQKSKSLAEWAPVIWGITQSVESRIVTAAEGKSVVSRVGEVGDIMACCADCLIRRRDRTHYTPSQFWRGSATLRPWWGPRNFTPRFTHPTAQSELGQLTSFIISHPFRIQRHNLSDSRLTS